ncbi:hypothetical protein J4731_15075 [Providencia rettgeri]|nr:hypothetical protein [Providencia rettgeri]
MALFEMSKLYHKGVVLNENENKANLILDKIIKKGGRDSVLVCDYLVEITLFDDDGNIKILINLDIMQILVLKMVAKNVKISQ